MSAIRLEMRAQYDLVKYIITAALSNKMLINNFLQDGVYVLSNNKYIKTIRSGHIAAGVKLTSRISFPPQGLS